MNRLIEEKRPELERICRAHRVRRIELFGSATGPGFDPTFDAAHRQAPPPSSLRKSRADVAANRAPWSHQRSRVTRPTDRASISRPAVSPSTQ